MAAYGSSTDTRHLEKHGKQYRAKLDIPRKLREMVGKAALKKSLGTDSLTEAQRLRWPALAELRKQLHEIARKAKAAPLDPIMAEALDEREFRQFHLDAYNRDGFQSDLDVVALYDQARFDARAERIAEEASPARAKEYLGIVKGERTPIDQSVMLPSSGPTLATSTSQPRARQSIAI